MAAVAGRVNLDPDKIYHYVPGEICVVASVAAGDPYADIQNMLNGEITRLLPLAGSGIVPGNSPEEQILESTARVWGDLSIAPADDSSGLALFRQPMRKAAQRSAPLQQDGAIIALHFFRVALAPPKSLVTMRQYRSVVRELVNLIHKVFIDVPAGQETRNGITFHAVSPNWLSSFAGCGGNSPGTPPAPVQPDAVIANNDYARFHFWDNIKEFGSSALENLVRTQRETRTQEMTVAVLDTCPPPGQVRTPPHDTRLLQEINGRNNPVNIEAFPSLDANADFEQVIPFLPNYLDAMRDWFGVVGTNIDRDLPGAREKYGAPDHGLFVAGIIKDIAPGAAVHLIRVLDDAGVGDLLGIAWVLSVLASGSPPRRLIINLSLTFDIPTDAELRDCWIKDSGWTSAIPAEVEARLGRILANVAMCIETLFTHLREKEILVVAAAGNDANGPAGRPDACLPARNPNVFSVSSVTRDPASQTGGGPSLFSNKSDGDHGIATLSGDGDLTTVPNTMLMESPPRQITDGVQGAFSGADMTSNATGNPADKVPNLSGWVLWAGTSFSTPIITALAAAIQANEKAIGNALLDPASLIKEVKRFADPRQPRGDLKCEIIYAYQQ